MGTRRRGGIVLGILLFAGAAAAKVPDTFTVQGVLRDGSGKLQSTMVAVSVTLFDSGVAGAGNKLAGPYQSMVMANNGLFTVTVTDGNLKTELANAAQVWVEMAANGSTFPRQPLTSEVYAIMAGHADEADGLSASCSGCVTDAMIGGVAGSKVTGKVAASMTADIASSVANGNDPSWLTALDGSKITGTLANAMVPAANVTGSLANATIPAANVTGALTNVTLDGSKVTGTLANATVPAANVSGTVASAMTAVNFTGALAGDVTGSQMMTSVGRIQGVPVAGAAPTANQVLKYNAATQQWAPGADLNSGGTVTSVASGAGLTGGPITSSGSLQVLVDPMGGLTTATASNGVGIANNGIVPAMVASGTYNINVSGNAANFTGSLGGDVNGGQTATTVVGLRGKLISTVAATDGQVLKYNAQQTQWVPATIASGTVTQINTGAGVTGGPITGTGTIGLLVNSGGGLTTGLGVGGDELGIAPGGITPAMVGAGTYGINISGNAVGFSGSLGGDVAGAMAATTVAKLQGVPVLKQTPVDGQVLRYNGTNQDWEPGNVTAANGTVTGVTASAPLQSSGGNAPNISLTGIVAPSNGGTGVAGPTAAGQYLRASGAGVWAASTISANDVTGTVASATNAIDFSGSLAGDVTGTQTATTVAGIQNVPVSSATPQNGQVLKYNTSTTPPQWVPAPDLNSGGTVTQINTTGGLTGGPISGSGTISIATGGVTNTMLANPTVTVGVGGGLSVTNGGSLALGGTITLANTGILSLTGQGAISVTGGQNATVSLGVVGTANGGTGLASSPTGAGQYLRSSGAGTWSIDVLNAGDIPNLSGTYVDLATNGQVVTGSKTFSSPINGSVTGTAGGFTGSLGGDVTGGQATTSVVGLRGTAISTTAPSSGQVLVYNTSTTPPQWVPTSPSFVSSIGVVSPISSTGGTAPTLSLGVVPTANGGTGLATAPTATHQFLKSTATNGWQIGGIATGDLPSLSGTYVDLGSAQTITGAKTIVPTANVAGLVVQQTSAATPTADVFDVQNAAGTSSFFAVTNTGAATFQNGVTAASFTGSGAGLINLSGSSINGGLVGIAYGGTGTASAPTAAGQYLRSTGPGAWGVGAIAATDLPSLSGSYVDLTTDAQIVPVQKVFQPTTDEVSLLVRQTSFSGPTKSVFAVQNPSATVNYFQIGSAGNGTFSGTVFATAFSGNGAALTSLNPANLSAGTAGISITGNAATATSATSFTGALGGDVTGTQGATVVGRIQGTAVAATAPTPNQVLSYNGSSWAPTTLAPSGIQSITGNAPINASTVAGATTLSLGTVGPANGGTGLTTFAAGTFLRASSANTWAASTLGAGDLPHGDYVDLTSNQSIGGAKTFVSATDVVSLQVRQNGVSNGVSDIFDVMSYNGGTAFLTINHAGNATFGGTISGNGSGLINLNASNLSTGTVSSALLTGSYNISITGNAATATSATSFSGSLAGDVTGTQGATYLSKLQGIPVSAAAPLSGRVLGYDGMTNTWIPQLRVDLVNNQTIAGTKTFAPTTNITGVVVQGSSATGATADVFDVTNAGGATNFLAIAASGAATFSGNVAAASFSGNGNALTNLNAANLAGTVPTGALSGTYDISISGSAGSFSGALAGDVTGTQGATTVARIQGYDVNASAPITGQALVYTTVTSPASYVPTSVLTSFTASYPLAQVTNTNGAVSLSLGGIVGTANGGTGIGSSPSAGDFLRSNVAGSWTAGPLTAGDIPNLSGTYVDLGSSGQQITGVKTFTNSFLVGSYGAGFFAAGSGAGGSLELGAGDSFIPPANFSIAPYVDFHYINTGAASGAASDYNMRLINDLEGRLTLDYGGTASGTTSTLYLPGAASTAAGTMSSVSVGFYGAQLWSDQGGSLELGAGDAGTCPNCSPYVDFHWGSNAPTAQDYNVRLQNNANGTLTLSAPSGVTPTLTFGGGGGFVTNATYYGVGAYLTSLNGANIQTGTITSTAVKAPTATGPAGAGTGGGIVAYPANLYTLPSAVVNLAPGGSTTLTVSCAGASDFLITGGYQETDGAAKLFAASSFPVRGTAPGTWQCTLANSDTLNPHPGQCWVLCYPHP